MCSVRFTLALALFAIPVLGGSEEPADWRSTLVSEISRFERLRLHLYAINHGAIQVPVTLPMADVFETVPEAKLAPFLQQLRGAKGISAEDADYIGLCLEVIHQGKSHGMPYDMSPRQMNGQKSDALWVVDFDVQVIGPPAKANK